MNKIIAVDFDGTLCENIWPNIGLPNTNLINFLKAAQRMGFKLILWTCRVGDKLDTAVKWCTKQGLHFDAINENLPEAIEKFGGDSRKVYADFYIDDKNDTKFPLPFKAPFKLGSMNADAVYIREVTDDDKFFTYENVLKNTDIINAIFEQKEATDER